MTACRLGAEPVRVFDASASGALYLNVPSLTPYADRKYFAANFVDVLTVDFDTGRIAKAPIRNPSARQTQPTGLYYAPANKALFVAEYLLNKVSVHAVDGDALQFLFEFGGMVSPEGLVFDAASSMLFVAEFDGHAVSAWRIDLAGRKARLAWRQEVKYAHGITLTGGELFVSGLLSRDIHVFDSASGSPLRVLGSQGWDPASLQFQWPTALDADRDGNLVVADAETGYVTVIDPRSDTVVSVLGGAGPGRGRFSQPYVAALNLAGDQLAVVSTKDERFVLLDYPKLCPSVSLYRSADRWAGFPLDAPVFRVDGTDYLWTSGPVLSFLGVANLIIYNNSLLDRSSGGVVDLNGVQGAEYPMVTKQLQAVRIAGTDLLFSPYAMIGPVLVRDTGTSTYAIDFPSSLHRDDSIVNCWSYEGGIRCSRAVGYDTDRMLALFSGFIGNVEAGRCRNGLVPLAVLERELNSLRRTVAAESNTGIPPVDLSLVFASPKGKAFLQGYSAIDACAATADQIARVRGLAADKGARESLFDLSFRSVLVGSY